MSYTLKNVGTGNSYPLANFLIQNAVEDEVDMINPARLSRDLVSVFPVGTEIQLYEDTTRRFGGYICMPSHGTFFEPTCESYGGELRRTLVNKVYENKSPEYIVEDIITKYTGLTYAGTWTSGLTLEKIVIKHRYGSDVISKLCELFNCQFRTDSSKNAYLEDRGTTTCSGDDLVVGNENAGGNCIITDKWTIDPSKIVNYLVVKGGSEDFTYHETFAGPGTEFTLKYKPTGNVRVTTSSGSNELTGQLPGDSGGDFSVDGETQKVTLASSASNVDIYYTYSLPILIVKTNPTSITAYGIRGKKIDAGWITRTEDAKTYATTYLAQYGTPTKSNRLMKKGLDWDYTAGAMKNVTDSYNGIDESMYIRKVEWNLAENATYIHVGTES